MIDKVEFTAKNLTSNAGVLLLLLKTLICGGFVGADKLKRFLLLKAEQLILKEIRKEPLKDTHKGNNCYNVLRAFCDELKALSVLGIHTPLMVLMK